jgi:CheY-like chemotaxis protein
MQVITMLTGFLVTGLLAIGGLTITIFPIGLAIGLPLLVIIGVPILIFKNLQQFSTDEGGLKRKFKVLIVDDDASSTLLLQVALKSISEKVHIDVVEAGKLAVTELVRKEYDLVFMDHEMPGLNGPTVVKMADRAISKLPDYLKHKVPVVTYTANKWEDWDADKLAYMNVRGHLSKGMKFTNMKQVVSQYLPSSTQQTAAVAA